MCPLIVYKASLSILSFPPFPLSVPTFLQVCCRLTYINFVLGERSCSCCIIKAMKVVVRFRRRYVGALCVSWGAERRVEWGSNWIANGCVRASLVGSRWGATFVCRTSLVDCTAMSSHSKCNKPLATFRRRFLMVIFNWIIYIAYCYYYRLSMMRYQLFGWRCHSLAAFPSCILYIAP